MGIISQVGRKKTEVKVLIGSVYSFLILGSISIIIPLMVMLTLSVASVTDVKQIALFPRYFYSQTELVKKYLAEKHNEKLDWVRQNYPVTGQEWLNWNQMEVPLEDWSGGLEDKRRTLAADWDVWLSGLESKFYVPAYSNEQGHGPSQVAFQRLLSDKYHSAEEFNARLKKNLKYISTATFPDDSSASTTWFYEETAYSKDYFEFKAGLEPGSRLPNGINRIWAAWLKFTYHEKVASLNKAWGSNYGDAFFNDVAFPVVKPSHPARAKDWEAFVKERYPRAWISLSRDHTPGYVKFVKARFKSVAEFNVIAETSLKDWKDLVCAKVAPHGAEVKFWSEFVASLPVDELSLDSAELSFSKFLAAKHGTLKAAEEAYAWKFSDAMGEGLLFPARVAEQAYFLDNAASLRLHFVTNNYFAVGRFLLQQGRSVSNTMILVVLSIFTALLVNPMAAYALSRFRLNYTPKVLLFLLATAAFPYEVTAIPQFLLIKEFGMLNTYWALILPGLVNGFWIFMLKGFFDSLPKELYEAAILEGANEYDLFVKITMPLAAPILALTAFYAFGAAYTGYIWNIIVANDSKMWTLMVSLQQYMGGDRPHHLVMAAMVLASIPTLIAFLMVQKVILKGVVIPTMH